MQHSPSALLPRKEGPRTKDHPSLALRSRGSPPNTLLNIIQTHHKFSHFNYLIQSIHTLLQLPDTHPLHLKDTHIQRSPEQHEFMSIENLRTFGESTGWLCTSSTILQSGGFENIAFPLLDGNMNVSLMFSHALVSRTWLILCDHVDPFAEADEDTGETKQSQNYIHIRIQRTVPPQCLRP